MNSWSSGDLRTKFSTSASSVDTSADRLELSCRGHKHSFCVCRPPMASPFILPTLKTFRPLAGPKGSFQCTVTVGFTHGMQLPLGELEDKLQSHLDYAGVVLGGRVGTEICSWS